MGRGDDAISLSWAFWVYLATIHAVLRLRGKQRDSGAQSLDRLSEALRG
jgi:hypothetical protein